MKQFSEKEIAAILKKAAANSSRDDSGAVGLTVEELEQLAADTGIDPEQIRRAAAELSLESESIDRTFLGGPFSFDSQVVLDREITAGDWEDMLVSIRKTFKSEGVVKTRESVFEWNSPWGSTNSANVTAVKENGKTKISVFWNGPMTALPYYIPVPLAAILSLFLAPEFLGLSAVPGFTFVLVAMALTFFAGRWALTRQMDKLFATFRQMMAEFQLMSARTVVESGIVSNPTEALQDETVVPEPRFRLDEVVGEDQSYDKPRGRDRSRS